MKSFRILKLQNGFLLYFPSLEAKGGKGRKREGKRWKVRERDGKGGKGREREGK